MSVEDNQRLSKERVFRHEFQFPSGKICQCTPTERGVSRFCPVEKALIERPKADAYQSLDEG